MTWHTLFSPHLLSVFTLLLAPVNAAEPIKVKLTFLNGDSITAHMTQWEDTSITVKHHALLEESQILKNNLLEIKLLNKATTKTTPQDQKTKNATTLTLKPRYSPSNENDTIYGELVQNGTQHITLNTAFAGRLNIQRSKILNIDIDTHSNLLYNGPNDIDEWHNTLHNSSWNLKKDALYSGYQIGNIAKDMKLPNRISLSFDLHWQNSAFLGLTLFSDDLNSSRPNNYYKIQISHDAPSVGKVLNGRPMPIELQKRNQKIIQNIRKTIQADKRAHYNFYIDKETGLFQLFVNGSLASTYQDKNPTPEKFGTILHLISGTNSPIKLLNLKIKEWNGYIPTNNRKQAFEKLKGEGQKILLKNGDAIIGKTGPIKDGLMAIETIYGSMKLRTSGIRTLDLSDTRQDKLIMPPNGVKLHYNEGGWIILSPIAINGNKLKAYHQAFGEAEFDLNAFKKIDLHIYKPTHNRARKHDTW